jgi:gluconolactonase
MIKAWIVLGVGAASTALAETYSLSADSLAQAGVPHGSVTKAVLPPGIYYPGTPHHYALYRPAGAAPQRALPFMIFLDGSGALGGLHIPVVLDNLIAKHELPPLAALFVDPGILPTVSAGAQHRYERIFEYDSTSSRFASFLLEELIPEAAKQQALSSNPDDRGLAGVSTGAVGALVAAWQRPDQFHRVLTLVGTFVDMKGAEELPSLIRKTEPRPLRILLQDGRNDHLAPDQPWGTFYAGSWPINNQVMFEALQFAGYDAKLFLGDGAHDSKQGAAMMPDALRWLWAGYPRPVAVREPTTMASPKYDPRGRVYSIVSAAHPWELVSGELQTVSNAAGDAEGNVYFADRSTDRIYRLSSSGERREFRAGARDIAVLRVGPHGQLIGSEPGQHRIVSYNASGDLHTAASRITARDVAVTQQGVLYFVDPATQQVGWLRADGSAAYLEQGSAHLAASGLSLSPDQAMLIVTDGLSRYSWSFQLAADGTPINGEPYYRLYLPELTPGSGVTAAACDALGQVYFATPLGIQVTEQNGRVAAVLNGPGYQAVTSVTFAGKDLKWLYVTAGGRLYRRPTKVSGVGSWAAVTPPQPPL